jgi:hypothetical protein
MTLVSFATKLARFRERSARTTARKEKWRQARARKTYQGAEEALLQASQSGFA